VYGTEPNAWVKKCFEGEGSITDEEKYLDVAELGAGEGRNAVYIAKLGYTVYTVDMSKEGQQIHASSFPHDQRWHLVSHRHKKDHPASQAKLSLDEFSYRRRYVVGTSHCRQKG
jgi:hypothetical protein